MLRNVLKIQRREHAADVVAAWADWCLRFILWLLWTLAIIAVGYWNWYTAAVAQRPINTLGLLMSCALTGLIGLVVVLAIGMRLELWQCGDDER